MTLQAANIARDGRHMVMPCGFSDVQRCKPHSTARGERGRRGAAGSRALADAERVAEAAQPGRKWTGLMRPAITQKDGDSHKIDYTRVGFETRSFFPCVRAGLPEDVVYHASTVESQSQT